MKPKKSKPTKPAEQARIFKRSYKTWVCIWEGAFGHIPWQNNPRSNVEKLLNLWVIWWILNDHEKQKQKQKKV